MIFPTRHALAALLALTLVACGGDDDDTAITPTGQVPTVELRDLSPGETCEFGGVELRSGIDVDNDGLVDTSELDFSRAVCNGEDGRDGLNGTNGEDGADGQDGEDGIIGEDGLTLEVETSPIEPGQVCANGGTLFTFGYDDNDDDAITGDEIVDTVEVCNGRDGTDGEDGVDGEDGMTSLMELETLGQGDATCTAGGVRLRVGFDTTGDGNIDDTSSTREICNGIDGQDGTNGQDGEDGLNTLVETSPLAVGNANCPGGGVQVTFGYDTTGDDTIDQVTSTESVCNGIDGQDGQDGEQGPTGPQGPAGEDGQDASGGGATLVDANGVTLGLVIGSTDADISVLTSAGYRVTMSWAGDFVNAATLEFSSTGCTGSTYLSYYNAETRKVWGRSVFYNPFNDTLLLASSSSIGADGIIVPTNATVASYLEAAGTCSELTPESSPTAPLVSTTAATVGLPSSIVGPLVVE